MRARVYTVVIGVVVVMAVCSPDTPADGPIIKPAVKYDTPTKLRAATMDKFRKLTMYRGEAGGSWEDKRVFIYLAEYLDANSVAMQNTAVDLVANLDYSISVAPFVKFLSERYPLPVRMAALSRCVVGTVSPAAQKMLNEYLPAAVVPPYFLGVVSRLYQAEGPSVGEGLIAREHHGVIARRTLYVVGDAENELQRERISSFVKRLGASEVIKEVRTWYPVEASADVRLFVLIRLSMRWYTEGSEDAMIIKDIVEIAKKDWDPRCVAKAKELERRCVKRTSR